MSKYISTFHRLEQELSKIDNEDQSAQGELYGSRHKKSAKKATLVWEILAQELVEEQKKKGDRPTGQNTSSFKACSDDGYL